MSTMIFKFLKRINFINKFKTLHYEKAVFLSFSYCRDFLLSNF